LTKWLGVGVSDWSQKQVNEALSDDEFRKMVEETTGTPVRVQIDLGAREIRIQGPKMGRAIDLDEFMQAWERDKKHSELQ